MHNRKFSFEYFNRPLHCPAWLFQRLAFIHFTPTCVSVQTMTKTQLAVEEDLLVDLTFHDFSANLLKEFASKVVKPYFKGNLNQAVQMLMEKALTEEALFGQTKRQ